MRSIIIFISLLFVVSCTSKGGEQKSVRVLVLGDSLTEGYGIAKEASYPSLVERRLAAEGKHQVKIINGGISGSTTASAQGRFRWHLKAKPDILILALGANDGLRGFELSATEKNLAGVIELAQKNDIKVILAGMKLPLNYGKTYRKNFENVYTKLAKKYDLSLIPFLLEGVGGVRSLNLPDGIHPNEEGHKKIAETVLKYLRKSL